MSLLYSKSAKQARGPSRLRDLISCRPISPRSRAGQTFRPGSALLATLAATVLMLAATTSAQAATAPIKQVLSSHIGWEVDKTKVKEGAPQAERKVCTVSSKDECQFGRPSSEPGGFNGPESVAVNNDPASLQQGDVYVVDGNNKRVQVLTPTGEFVLMFGWDVNKTKEKEGAPQTERNVCTAASGDLCQAGVEGAAAGQFAGPQSVTGDPASGDVYVQELFNWRVQEFTATGEFVLMLGKNVNKKGGNLCAKAEEGECQTGVKSPQGSSEPGAFNFIQQSGSQLAVGGPKGLLYVGDEHRVQEFEADGKWKGEIPLTSISPEPSSKVAALAVDNSCSLHNPVLTESTTPTCKESDPSYGNLYLVYRVNFVTNTVREFNPSGGEIVHFELTPREPKAELIDISAIALDPAGRLAVVEHERYQSNGTDRSAFRGLLSEVGTTSLHRVSEFTSEFPGEFEMRGSVAVAFDDGDNLYAAVENEIVSYSPVSVAELSTSPVACKAGADSGTGATVDCSLNGEANPWGVGETKVWFQWGKTTALSAKTGEQEVATGSIPVHVSAPLVGLLPNETYYERLAGYDKNNKPPEAALGSETALFNTPAVPARIIGEPNVLSVESSSVVMFGELNPENAKTEYFFEYGPEETLKNCPRGVRKESCPGLLSTPVVESNLYGVIGTTVEVTGLQPATVYHYRLLAEDENRAKTVRFVVPGPEGSFPTAPAPFPQATTGAPSAITATSAVVSGTVNPDGQKATYAFDLGIYNGGATQYGVVFSGPVATGTAPVPESLALTGLQPGTTYAYRITIKSGYVKSVSGTVEGEPMTFTTAGLPTVLFVPAVLGQLPVPPIAFPKEPAEVTPKQLTRAQQLARALKACKKQPRRKRASCKKTARKKYGPVKKKK